MNTPELTGGGSPCLSTPKSGRNSGGKLPYGSLSRIVNGFTRRTGRIYRRTQEMNKRIRKKQEKQRKQLEMKWLLDMAVAIDTAIQEYWQWREEMERRYVELYAEEIARRMGLIPKQ